MANVSITQLPTATTLTGTEAVPIVQNGATVQTTTAAIANSPVLTQTFLTVGAQPTLGNSRYLTVGPGLGTVDGGAAGPFSVNLTGAPLALNSSPLGFQVKTATNTLAGRSFQTGNGLAVTNPDGVAGDPVFTLTGIAAAIAASSGTGMLAIVGGTTIANRSIVGVADQIAVTDGNGAGNPTIGIASNPVLPGTGAVTVPVGTLLQRPVGALGQIRYNTGLASFEGYTSAGWGAIVAGAAVTLINTGTGLTGGPITSAGTISLADTAVTAGTYGSATQVGQFAVNAQGQLTSASNVTITASGIGAVASVAGTANEITATGTTNVTLSLPAALTFTGKTVTDGTFNMVAATVGADTVTTNTATQTLTNKSISGSANTLSAIPNSARTNSSVTFNGVAVALGASGTITAASPNALTIGTGLSGTSYNGSAAVTIAIDSTVATLTGTQTLTNKTISGSSNTLSNIGNASLTNSSVTVGTTAIALGASSLTLGGLTSVAVTQDPTSALQLATKQYVDAVAEGLHIHESCAAATPGTLASITGGTVTYNNGTAGVGATLTLSVALTVLDGYTLLNGDRVLVKNEATQANNGIYTWATGGTVLTRATDFDTAAEMASGDFTFITNGTLYANTGWVQTDPVTVVGTSPVTWIQFSGAGTYTAGTGLTLIGSQFSITNTGVAATTYGSASAVPVLAVNAQGQLTSVTNTAIAINGNQVTSGVVAIANGGSGQTTAQLAMNAFAGAVTSGSYLRGDGTNVLMSTIQVADVPTLNQNTTGTASNVTGTVAVANGGTGATTLTGYIKGNGTSAFTASATIPSGDISGLGTMSTQNANSVAITGGAINGTTIGATTATTGKFTTVTATTGVFGGTF
jgi:hypothetical protein